MPSYDLQCKVCGHRWEQTAKYDDFIPCPECKSLMVKKIIYPVEHRWNNGKP